MTAPTLEEIRQAPKALLHDHLDGGLRPATIVEIAEANGYDQLPTNDPEELGEWFVQAADSGSLERYLETFAHTVGVMQTTDALHRVAAECAEDLAEDGVVYAEVRFAPEQHTERDLSLEQVVEAVLAGFAEGSARATEKGRSIRVGALLTAMRHAGEGFGLPSIWQAIQWCGADRLGHGVRIVDDVSSRAGGAAGAELGRLASYVRDKRIPLEMCPSSNVQTGAAPSIAEHPIGLLRDLRFRVTVNTDNRLMSGTSMSREMALLVDAFGYGWAELQWFTVNAMKSAFIPFDERLALINEPVKPAYAKLIAS